MFSHSYKHSHNNISDCLPSCEKNIITPTKRLFNVLKLWKENSRSRKHLANLDHRLLQDVGITATEVDQEITKPFWRK